MTDKIWDVKGSLLIINKRINQIEDQNANFANNPEWQVLDCKRTTLYEILKKLEKEQKRESENIDK